MSFFILCLLIIVHALIYYPCSNTVEVALSTSIVPEDTDNALDLDHDPDLGLDLVLGQPNEEGGNDMTSGAFAAQALHLHHGASTGIVRPAPGTEEGNATGSFPVGGRSSTSVGLLKAIGPGSAVQAEVDRPEETSRAAEREARPAGRLRNARDVAEAGEDGAGDG